MAAAPTMRAICSASSPAPSAVGAGLELGEVGGRRRRRGRKVDVGRGFQRTGRRRHPHRQRHGAVTRGLEGDAVLVGEAGGRATVEAGQGGGIGGRRHAAAAGCGQLAEHGAVALVGHELDHVGPHAGRRRLVEGGGAGRVAPVGQQDDRPVAGVGGELRAGERDRVVQRGLAGRRQLGDPRRERGPVGGRAGDERGLRPEGHDADARASGGSTVRNSVAAARAAVDRRPDHAAGRVDDEHDLEARRRHPLHGVVDGLAVLGHLEGRGRVAGAAQAGGAVTTAVTAG